MRAPMAAVSPPARSSRPAPPGTGEAGGHCLSFRGNDELDKLSFPCCWVPGDDVVAGSQLIIDKLVQRDRAVRQIGFRKARTALQKPQSLRRFRDQSHRDAITR